MLNRRLRDKVDKQITTMYAVILIALIDDSYP